MASIKKKSSGGGGANWMDTYGDMVTLLLCFFVLLYSMSTIDQEKWMLIVQSFNKNAEVSVDDFPRGPEGDSGEEGGDDMPTTDSVETQLEELFEFLKTATAAQAENDSVSVSKGDGYVFISFSNALFFDGDRYTLRQEGKDVLDVIIPLLEEKMPIINEIKVSGHTATALGQYSASKDRHLAANRAAEVVVYLQEHSNILDPTRMVDVGYGQFRPVAGNDQESERSKNRRVEMMISGVDVEDAMSDSITQYYTSTGQTQPVTDAPAG